MRGRSIPTYVNEEQMYSLYERFESLEKRQLSDSDLIDQVFAMCQKKILALLVETKPIPEFSHEIIHEWCKKITCACDYRKCFELPCAVSYYKIILGTSQGVSYCERNPRTFSHSNV